MNARRGLITLIILTLLVVSYQTSEATQSPIPLWEKRQLVINDYTYNQNPKVFLNGTEIYMIFGCGSPATGMDFCRAVYDPETGWEVEGPITSISTTQNEYDSMVWGDKIFVTTKKDGASYKLWWAYWNGEAATSPLSLVTIDSGNTNIFEIFATHLEGQTNPWLYFNDLSSDIHYFEMLDVSQHWTQATPHPTYSHNPALGSTDTGGICVAPDSSVAAISFVCSGTVGTYCLGDSDNFNVFLLLPNGTPNGLSWTFIDWSNNPAYNPQPDGGGNVSCGGPFWDLLGSFYVGCGYGIYMSTTVSGDGWCMAANHEDLITAGIIDKQYESQLDCCDTLTYTCLGPYCNDPSWNCPGTECQIDTDCAEWCSGFVCDNGFCVDSGMGNPCPEDNDVCNGITTCNSTSNECETSDPLNCNDSNPCTDDSCNPSVGCVNTNNTASCNDGDLCNGTDTCSGGTCSVHTNPLDCNDSNPCTDDSCIPSTGCHHENNTNSCDDGLYCTQTDVCSDGTCHGSGDPCPPSYTCDESTDSCIPPADDDTSPDDDSDDDTTPVDDDTSPDDDSDDDTGPDDDNDDDTTPDDDSDDDTSPDDDSDDDTSPDDDSDDDTGPDDDGTSDDDDVSDDDGTPDDDVADDDGGGSSGGNSGSGGCGC